MTSKISFSKMVFSEFRRRIWLLALLFLGFFVVLPLGSMLTIGNYQESVDIGGMTLSALLQECAQYASADNWLVVFCIGISAVLAAFSGFAYLHSRKKLDLIHSLPLKRQTVFGVHYISGLLLFCIPYAFNLLLMMIVYITRTVCTTAVLVSMLTGIFIHLLYFLLIYHTAILALLLTGRILTGALGMLVFCVYAPLMKLVLVFYHSHYLDTYYPVKDSWWETLSEFLSPASMYYRHAALFMDQEQNSLIVLLDHWPRLLAGGLITIALLLLAIWLYRLRPSETALRSMAFPKTEPVIKILLILLGASVSGLFFSNLSMSASELWMLFGVIFGAVITHCLVEVIYTYEFRRIFSHKGTLLAAMGAVLLVTAAFHWDILRYDTSLPKKEQIAAMSLSIPEMDTYIEYGRSSDWRGSGPVPEEYRFTHGEMEDFSTAYTIAELGIENEKVKKFPQGDTVGVETAAAGNECIRVNTRYRMKNGTFKYRSYSLSRSQISDLVQELYDQQEFKEGQYPLLKSDIAHADTQRVSITSGNYYNIPLDFVQDQAAALLEAYRQDLREASGADMTMEQLVGSIDFRTWEDETVAGGYRIYRTFARTMALLQEYGYELAAKPKSELINKASVYDYEDSGHIVDADLKDGVALGNNGELVFTNPEDLDQIVEAACFEGAAGLRESRDIYVFISVQASDSREGSREMFYRFPYDRIPACVTEATGR